MKKQKGSYTIEAVIVMTTIIMLIFAIISAFLLLYQNAVMYYVASQAAQEGAVMWVDASHTIDGEDTGADPQDGNVYYRIGELFSGSAPNDQEKEKKIKGWAEKRLKEMMPNTLIGSGAEEVNVTFHNYVVRQVVEVSITKEVDIPVREIAQYFDQDLDIHVNVKASLAEPAEYIRNIDYAIELASEVWQQISGKFSEIFNSAKKK